MTLQVFLVLPLVLAVLLGGLALPFVSPIGVVAWALIGAASWLRKRNFTTSSVHLCLHAMGCQTLLDLVLPELGDIAVLVGGLLVVALARKQPILPRAVARGCSWNGSPCSR